jgi:hypothetical protein
MYGRQIRRSAVQVGMVPVVPPLALAGHARHGQDSMDAPTGREWCTAGGSIPVRGTERSTEAAACIRHRASTARHSNHPSQVH